MSVLTKFCLKLLKIDYELEEEKDESKKKASSD